MNDKFILAFARTEKIKDSVNELLRAYDHLKDLGENVEGGRLYGCLLETKRLAEEYQRAQLVEVVGEDLVTRTTF